MCIFRTQSHKGLPTKVGIALTVRRGIGGTGGPAFHCRSGPGGSQDANRQGPGPRRILPLIL